MKMKTKLDWRSSEAEALASNYRASETSYCRPENVGIFAIIIPELRLSNVQRQALGRNLVEAANPRRGRRELAGRNLSPWFLPICPESILSGAPAPKTAQPC
jgi:hypothetical protein